MTVTGLTDVSDPQSDAIWILSSTFIVFTMQSGKYGSLHNLVYKKVLMLVQSNFFIPTFDITTDFVITTV